MITFDVKFSTANGMIAIFFTEGCEYFQKTLIGG